MGPGAAAHSIGKRNCGCQEPSAALLTGLLLRRGVLCCQGLCWSPGVSCLPTHYTHTHTRTGAHAHRDRQGVQWLGRWGKHSATHFFPGFSFLTWEMQTSTLAFIRGTDETRGAGNCPVWAGVGQCARKGTASAVSVTLKYGVAYSFEAFVCLPVVAETNKLDRSPHPPPLSDGRGRRRPN